MALVIGSQPGHHLQPLYSRWGEQLITRHVPPWTAVDLAALADRLGLTGALTNVGVTDDRGIAEIRDALGERADGNPLYARYLTRALVAGLHDGTITSPSEWVAGAPIIAGDIAVYYAHLYRSASAQAQAIADLLGVIDFAATESELREMVPAFVGAWVPPALAQLTPVLTAVTGQGGVRIFHESFRRFMTQELARQGRSPADALTPVISWLDTRGFYDDAKAYRFLLPALRRAGRGAEVLARVNVKFVSDSVAQAHPLHALQRNLALAADVAAQLREWPALVRCVELHRAAYTCFDEAQNDWRDYWATYLALFGATALSERLLFDGRATLSASDGLYACALVDDAGGTPPWREYLALHDAENDGAAGSSHMSDQLGSLTPEEHESLRVVHGRLRLGAHTRIARKMLEYLHEAGDSFKPLFLRRLASRVARMTGEDLVERIAQRADPARRAGPRITTRAAAVLRLGIADELARRGDTTGAYSAASRAVVDADSPELVAACICHGASPRASGFTFDPASYSIAVGPDEHLHDANGVRSWVGAVRACAANSIHGETILDAEVRRVEGIGWYRCWLRFVLALARVESARRLGEAGDVRGAFAELTRDVHPFRGKPRACDLWSIHLAIQESIEWGLTLLQTEADWQDALGALAAASRETASRMDREDGGPIPTGTLLEVLLPYAMHPVGGALVRVTMEQQMARLEVVGTYYPTHAEYAMRVARARHAAGDEAGAREAWVQGAVFLSAYGWRKDVTVFDIIESAPVLHAVSRKAALDALADAQPLVNAVVAHTDQRSTNRAPNAWLRSVLEVHPPVGVAVLARTLIEEDGPGGWPNAQAIQDVAVAAQDSGDPVLLDALLATLRFNVEYEEESAERADARLAPVVRLVRENRELAAKAFRRVAAEVTGDGRRYTEAAASRVAAVADEHGIAIPRITPPVGLRPTENLARSSHQKAENTFRLPNMRVPPFPPNATFVDLLTGMRTAGAKRGWDEVSGWDDVVLALSYYVGDLADGRRDDDARRLLRFFARDVDVSSGREHPLGKLAVALETAGYTPVAAVAYALAYTATRGGGGWRRMGDKEHGHLIERGLALDAAAAQQVLADEVAYALRGSWYSMGTSRHLVERLAAWGEPEAAAAAWREAFAVIRHRLPLAPEDGWFARLRDAKEPDWPDASWSVDEALIALLLARMADPRLAQKVTAFAGIVHAITRRSDVVAVPMRWWLTRNTPITSVLLALSALNDAEVAPFQITCALEDVLQAYAASNLWGVRRLAAGLLERAGQPFRNGPSGSYAEEDHSQRDDPDRAHREALLSADVGGVVNDISALWPELRGRVARRLDALFSVDGHREHAKTRYELAYGRRGDAYPPTPTLYWEVELFQAVLHEELCGLSEQLWKSGQWEPEIEDAVLCRVLPNMHLHLGLAAGRTVRPAWPAAETVTEGVGVLPMVSDDDPTFFGWIRLALIERQYRPDPARTYERPVEAITVFAGAVAAPLGETIPSGVLPFRDGDVDDWWWPDPPPVTFPARLPIGQVVRLSRWTDWLGSSFVLIPPEEFQNYLQLGPARYGGPLLWYDQEGHAALALRTWRVRNSEALFADPTECEGADLLIRPDLFEALTRRYLMPLQELRVVWRRPITDTPGVN